MPHGLFSKLLAQAIKQALGICRRERFFAAEVGAPTGLFPHHTTKDGRATFGSQGIIASAGHY
jgi:hypothetical protein